MSVLCSINSQEVLQFEIGVISCAFGASGHLGRFFIDDLEVSLRLVDLWYVSEFLIW